MLLTFGDGFCCLLLPQGPREDVSRVRNVEKMAVEAPDKLSELLTELYDIRRERRPEVVTSLPRMEEQIHWHSDEPVHTTGLLADWDTVHQYLEDNGINVIACAATA